MRTCQECKKAFPETNEFFVRQKLGRNGLAGKCRTCTNAVARRWSSENRQTCRERAKRYYNNNFEKERARGMRYRESLSPEESLAASRKWWSSVCAETKREYARRYRKKNPEKRGARSTVKDAVKSGKLRRPPKCGQCHQKCKPDAHHDDYSKRLDVKWLCRPCHMALHRGRRVAT